MHDSLKKYLELEEEAFCFAQKGEESGYVWRYEFTEEGRATKWRWNLVYAAFSSFGAAKAAELDVISDLEKQDVALRIVKMPADGREIGVSLELNGAGEALSADPVDLARLRGDKKAEEAARFFEDLWFAFPTPFQKGDLVRDMRGIRQSVAVFEETAADLSRRRGRPLRDYTDMVAYCVLRDPFGTFYKDCVDDYTSLEAVSPEELTGKDRILIPLSRFVKGEIDFTLLVKATRLTALESDILDLKEYMLTPEDLADAGLSEKG